MKPYKSIFKEAEGKRIEIEIPEIGLILSLVNKGDFHISPPVVYESIRSARSGLNFPSLAMNISKVNLEDASSRDVVETKSIKKSTMFLKDLKNLFTKLQKDINTLYKKYGVREE